MLKDSVEGYDVPGRVAQFDVKLFMLYDDLVVLGERALVFRNGGCFGSAISQFSSVSILTTSIIDGLSVTDA